MKEGLLKISNQESDVFHSFRKQPRDLLVFVFVIVFNYDPVNVLKIRGNKFVLGQ